jgi:hypothetical protein
MKRPDDIENIVSQQLDNSLDDIDEATADKLKAARLKALQAAGSKDKRHDNIVLLSSVREWPRTSLSLAASLLLAAPLWYFSVSNLPQPAENALPDTIPLAYSEESQLNALDLITTYAELDDDELDMVDDLDFALWLVDQEGAPQGSHTYDDAVNG